MKTLNRARLLNVNLATRPLRNRRLFLFLGGGVGLAFLVTALAAIVIFLHFGLKKSAARTALQEVETTVRKTESEQKRLANRVGEAEKKDQDIIDTINGIILKKSLSWTDFLSKLEECLPESSYILSLSIPQVDSTRIQLRIRVVSRNLDDLLALINKLQGLNFSRPRVETEEKNDQGQLVSDISVIYERTVEHTG